MATTTEIQEFLRGFPEFRAIGTQNRDLVEAKYDWARREWPSDDPQELDLRHLCCAALLADSPVGRAAGLMRDKATTSTYQARLDVEVQARACGGRFQ